LEVEFSFTQPWLEPQTKPIQSLIAQFTGGEPEAHILCLSPTEIAADKLSALTWRILKRDRSRERDDPAMIRHLHDLCALTEVINSDFALFKATAVSTFDVDQQSISRQTTDGLNESIAEAINLLTKDGIYKNEYRQFVDAVSFADDEDNIEFEDAIQSFKELGKRLQ